MLARTELFWVFWRLKVYNLNSKSFLDDKPLLTLLTKKRFNGSGFTWRKRILSGLPVKEFLVLILAFILVITACQKYKLRWDLQYYIKNCILFVCLFCIIVVVFFFLGFMSTFLTLAAPIPQNGHTLKQFVQTLKTHSNELFECVCPFCKVGV